MRRTPLSNSFLVMSVHYKFKTCLNYDKVTFDGVHISVGDLKKAIMQQKKIGKSADFDLQITNQQTKEVYDNDDLLIPKNTTVIVARIPVTGSKKHWERNEQSSSSNNSPAHIALEKIIKSSDLSSSNASEEEKIKQMMSQSTQDYDSSKFVKSRGMVGPLPPNYTCYRCGQPGHYIKHCPTNNMEIKRSTGIPRSFMKPASADQKGALLTPSGEYAVPIIDHEAYKEVKKEKPPFLSNNETEVNETTAEIPENLQCMLCRDLLQDAVLIHCCGNSYCDECMFLFSFFAFPLLFIFAGIRTNLLESEQHECPTCNTTGISPDTLIPNRFLRNAVLKFKNETGYSKPKRDDLVCEQNVSIKDSCNGSVLQAVVDDKLSIETVSKYNETSEVQVKTDALQDDENDKKPSLEISNQGEYQTVNENEKETAQKPNSEMVETKTEMTEQPENENNLQELKPETSINVESAESEKIETSNEVVEEYNDSTNNECSSATNNKNIKTMSIRNVIRPVTSIMQQGIAMHRAPILPHPPRMFHRPGIPHDPRFYRTPMRDPHGYSLAMGPGPGPYGYGGAHMRPHSYPDPYGFMGHRPPHMHSTQFPRPHLLGHPQNYNEPPPPGSSPHNVLGEKVGHVHVHDLEEVVPALDLVEVARGVKQIEILWINFLNNHNQSPEEKESRGHVLNLELGAVLGLELGEVDREEKWKKIKNERINMINIAIIIGANMILKMMKKLKAGLKKSERKAPTMNRRKSINIKNISTIVIQVVQNPKKPLQRKKKNLKVKTNKNHQNGRSQCNNDCGLIFDLYRIPQGSYSNSFD
ncbi:E3 ubiquitin-protein ligase RBBP6-like protein [Dinothrombium tinctorium]|uniref:E3 ubiquitin-protein ligase RBBP6-like protein n=1 Tax=Dinothrombium tinctorium TaxID=1965070 RepID=A0A3S3P6Q3_9ACAR|nr:E3 ubiquitin-protein ligase RBBP6-like protein [Dinothrombium tinctorium]RWS16092.1 E3 ubiquitin-protein ligase RBBP6-like protein [Dinothrombium tinctorium]